LKGFAFAHVELHKGDMKILIEISDTDTIFAMKVLRSLSFVKKVKPIGQVTGCLWDDLEEAGKEVRLHKDGKIKLQKLEKFLREI